MWCSGCLLFSKARSLETVLREPLRRVMEDQASFWVYEDKYACDVST